MNNNLTSTMTVGMGITGYGITTPSITCPNPGHWTWIPAPIPIWKKVKPKSKRRASMKRRRKVVKNKGQKETYITLVLDRSSSMCNCYQAALDAINEQIETIKSNAHKGGKTYVSLIIFDHEVEVIFENEPAEDLEHLTKEEYVLRGSTALRDAVMGAIDLMEEHENDDKNQGFLVVLISDGQENCSGVSREELQSRIEEANGSNRWTFTYMLDGHNWEQVREWAITYQTPLGNMCSYTADVAGTARAGVAMSGAVSNYMNSREEGKTESKTFYNTGTGEESKV